MENPISEPEPKEFSPLFREMLEKLKAIQEEKGKQAVSEVPPIKTNWVITSAAKAYEKIRNTIDYREENVLRRSAIERILRRRLRLGEDSAKIAPGLTKELIQAGYISDKDILSSEVIQISKIINKYLALAEIDSERSQKYYLSLASAEIENLVAPRKEEKAILATIEKVAQEEIKNLSDESKNIQLSLALHRIFLKFDPPLIKHLLLTIFLPQIVDWEAEGNYPSIQKEDLAQANQKITQALDNPLSRNLTKLVKRYYPLFIFFQEVVAQDPARYERIFSSSTKLEAEVSYFTEESYARTKLRLIRSIIRAILFIFITKMILGIAAELPYDLYVIHKTDYTPLIINLLFPPGLMFISSSLIRVPGRTNTEKLIVLIKDIVYKGRDESYEKEIKPRRSLALNTLLGLIYLLTFVTTFSLLVWLLISLDFNLVSAILFFFFLSVVSFFAFRIRESTKELLVIEEKEGLVSTLLDFFLLPFLKIGHWLSVKFAQVNVFLFLFDFVIEAPFKTILEVIENWLAFMKEKKEEMMS